MMLKKYLFILLMFFAIPSIAQVDSSRIRISLLTCGSGQEPWETFGHTAIRITDTIGGTDNVYNYGTFNGYDDGFLLKFVRGKLSYYLSYYPYQDFVAEYAVRHRSVREQLLQLSGSEKIQIYNFLINNSKDENKYYQYDFFFDNCATRVRDVLKNALGNQFAYGNVIPSSTLSYRNIINLYFYKVHWQHFGVNLLLGSKIDKNMTNMDIMFLPDYLERSIAKATLKGKPIAHPSQTIVEGSKLGGAGINGPFVLTSFIGLFTVFSMMKRSWKKARAFIKTFILFTTGVLGCIMLIMWFATDHQGCSNNFNILWALPTNVIAAFIHNKHKSRYALVAICLLITSLILHILKVQELPLLEIGPILLSLLLVFGSIFRKATFQKEER